MSICHYKQGHLFYVRMPVLCKIDSLHTHTRARKRKHTQNKQHNNVFVGLIETNILRRVSTVNPP
jgi:hypothetical protein